jgi:hypothetical protein
MTSDNPATVTVVTGPLGHDIGHVTAYLGRNLGDGLAIRTVQPSTLRRRRTPNPYGAPHTIDLGALPSAWQNPDTNLGVAVAPQRFNSPVGLVDTLDQIRDDISYLERAGLSPAHRLTVQGASGAHHIWPAVEYGDLAAAARDHVLRASAGGSRQVLVEAGDGQTFLDAFGTVGLPPWSPHIERLELWLVLDIARLVSGASGAIDISGMIGEEVARQGGGTNGRGEQMPVLRVALCGFHILVPEVYGHGSAPFALSPEQGGPVSKEAADRVGDIITTVEQRAGTVVGLLGTGTGPDGYEQVIDLSL